jgi:hypothetical protein
MPETDIGSSSIGDMTSKVSDILVDSENTDGSQGMETKWTNDKWSEWFGYYKNIPEVKTAIDMRAIWTLGKGYKADARTTIILDHITGWGRDTFNSILKNMIVTRRIGGDAFAEIVRDPKDKSLMNLKPLDPATITIVVNKQGILQRYEQKSKSSKAVKKFMPNQIFHLLNKRVADEFHGVSDIEAIEKIIKANNESFEINKQIVKNFSKPKMMVEIDSDDTTKIAEFIAKFDDATSKGDNLFYPKDTVNPQVLAVPSNATLNVLPWREHLKNYFFQVVGIPQIILGSSGEFTESTAKIAYLAFQQSVEDEQLDIEEQIWNQLYLKIELEFPATMQNELISDSEKDGQMQQTDFQPNDIEVPPEENSNGS